MAPGQSPLAGVHDRGHALRHPAAPNLTRSWTRRRPNCADDAPPAESCPDGHELKLSTAAHADYQGLLTTGVYRHLCNSWPDLRLYLSRVNQKHVLGQPKTRASERGSRSCGS